MIAKMGLREKYVPSASNYGRCQCSGIYEERLVEVRFSVRDRPILFRGVSQGACFICGSRVYKMHVLERLEAFMRPTPD